MAQGIDRVGLLRSRGGCCLFTWRDVGMVGARKTIELHDGHCDLCVRELQRMAPTIRLVDRRRVAAIVSLPRSVLVVDDDEDIREELRDALVEQGWQVTCVEDGAQALEYLRSGAPLPAVILLDLMMPVMDGHQFCEHQSSDPALAGIPVVVVTAGRDRPRAPTAAVVRKPFRMEAVTKAIETQLAARA
jgi:CheY-like chemotaxis protein